MIKLGSHIRNALGKLVRDEYVKVREERHTPSHIRDPRDHKPWEHLSEDEQELCRRMGEAVYMNLRPEGGIRDLKTRDVPQEELRSLLTEAGFGLQDNWKHKETGDLVVTRGIMIDETTLTVSVLYYHKGLPFVRSVVNFKERFEPVA